MVDASAAKALHDGANALAMQCQRIDDAAHILDGNIIDEPDVTSLGINRDVGCMGSIAVGALVAGEHPFSRKPCELAQRERAPARTGDSRIVNGYVLLSATKPVGSGHLQRIAQPLLCNHDGRTAHYDPARAEGSNAFADIVCRAVEHAADLADWNLERIRRDLRADRLQALSYGGRPNINGN